MPRTAKKVTRKTRMRKASNVHVHIHPPAQPTDDQVNEAIAAMLAGGNADGDGPFGDDSDPDSDPLS
jgi:hypothetical protein